MLSSQIGVWSSPHSKLWRKIDAMAQVKLDERLLAKRIRKSERGLPRAREVKRLKRHLISLAAFGRALKCPEILEAVASKHNLTVEDLKTPRRVRRISWPRQEAMYRLKLERRLSYPQIGRIFGNYDHTSCLHACRAHAQRNGLPPP